jgi:branched-chain amino acid transport system permease protein
VDLGRCEGRQEVSAAAWRKAMNTGAAGHAWRLPPRPAALPATAPAETPASFAWRVKPRHLVVLAALLLYPWVASPFFTYQIGGQSLVLGLIALSLMFLAGYGGMVSLSQMTIAGVAGYMVAIFGVSATPEGVVLGWPWWLAVIVAVVIATLVATLIGWLSVRTDGIYTIMITLAVGVAFYYLVLQNYSVFSGFQGFQKVLPPVLFGVDWRSPVPFYYLALFWALAGYFAVKYVSRAPFGLALQGIRDNARRMEALGFNVNAHRIAAHAAAGAIAAVGGILLTWYSGLITPGSVGTNTLINILIIAVIGGLRHPIGPFIGAIVFVLLQNFAIVLVNRERFNLVIGTGFLLIVLFSPDGLLGLWARLVARFGRGSDPSPLSSRSGD